ncbi:hypothetical protein P4E94_06555 [Pontiellaceae bacterium B12219]|nr:hypothetical protein [Pontiellaceae bacterium B12219]
MDITYDALKLFVEEVNSAHRYVLGENGTNDSDALAPYTATQITAEWFKNWGYDGLQFKSSIHPTVTNDAMFDINMFDSMESCELHTIGNVKYECHRTNNEFTRHCERIS